MSNEAQMHKSAFANSLLAQVRGGCRRHGHLKKLITDLSIRRISTIKAWGFEKVEEWATFEFTIRKLIRAWAFEKVHCFIHSSFKNAPLVAWAFEKVWLANDVYDFYDVSLYEPFKKLFV